MTQTGTVYTKSFTATSASPFQVETQGDNYLTSVNIHCYTNDCYYGGAPQLLNGIIRANAVVWFDGIVRVSDLWFKNYTGASNCTIVIIGILQKKE
jgi:hypothetical protein